MMLSSRLPKHSLLVMNTGGMNSTSNTNINQRNDQGRNNTSTSSMESTETRILGSKAGAVVPMMIMSSTTSTGCTSTLKVMEPACSRSSTTTNPSTTTTTTKENTIENNDNNKKKILQQGTTNMNEEEEEEEDAEMRTDDDDNEDDRAPNSSSSSSYPQISTDANTSTTTTTTTTPSMEGTQLLRVVSEQPTSTSSNTTTTTTAGTAAAATAAIDQLQEQISYYNEIGMDLLKKRKYKTSLYYFSKALQLLQNLSNIKKQQTTTNEGEVPTTIRTGEAPVVGSLSIKVGSIQHCRPMSIDTLHSAWNTNKWEVFNSISLMYNCSLVHIHDNYKLNESKHMLTLGIQLLKTELPSAVLLNEHLRQSNCYAAMVITSLYNLLSITLKQLKLHNESKKSFMAAIGLQKRFLSIQRRTTTTTTTNNNNTKKTNVTGDSIISRGTVASSTIVSNNSTKGRNSILPSCSTSFMHGQVQDSTRSSCPQSPISTTASMNVTTTEQEPATTSSETDGSNNKMSSMIMVTTTTLPPSRSFSSSSSSLSDSRQDLKKRRK